MNAAPFYQNERLLVNISRWGRSILTILMLAMSMPGNATPYKPAKDQDILEHLPLRPGDPSTAELRKLRAAWRRDTHNLAFAVELARHYIEQSRIDSDPRFLGYAQATLAPWWNQAQPPLEALVLRATVRSGLHEFDAALVDLDFALRLQPGHTQARLTRASLFQLRGQYAKARRDCLTLLRSGMQLTAYACLTTVTSLDGQAKKSHDFLYRALQRTAQATPAEKRWIHGLLAEMAARLGDAKRADAHFRIALQGGEPDAYLLGAYADFLLDQHRLRDVVKLLAGKTRADGLLLRLTLAERKLNSPLFAQHVAELKARFAAARMRGDTRHLREEARFLLSLQDDPSEALRLAERNWTQQREPADARLLIEAAQAAHSPRAAQPVLDWLAQTRLEDVALTRIKAASKESKS